MESQVDHDCQVFAGADLLLREDRFESQLAGIRSTLRCDPRDLKPLWDLAAYLNRPENSFLDSSIRVLAESVAESLYFLLPFIEANSAQLNACGNELLKPGRSREDTDQALIQGLRQRIDEVESRYNEFRSAVKGKLDV